MLLLITMGTALQVVDKIDINKALKLKYLHKNTDEMIGKVFGVTRQAVNKRLKPFQELMTDQSTLEAFQGNYTNILRNASMLLSRGIVDPKKIEAASLNTVANHLRLEENKTTDNVGFQGLVAHIQKSADDLDNMKDALFEAMD
jgi:hypothetical protein